MIVHQAGRVGDGNGLHAAGWLKRGPSGIVGTNRACAVETLTQLLADAPVLASRPVDAGGLFDLLRQRGLAPTDYADWLAIKAEELRCGAAQTKPREKLVTITDLLSTVVRTRASPDDQAARESASP